MHAEEYTDWEAQKAAQIRAKELLGIEFRPDPILTEADLADLGDFDDLELSFVSRCSDVCTVGQH